MSSYETYILRNSRTPSWIPLVE